MAAVTYLTDTQIAVMRTNGFLPLVGFDSQFDTTPHPATGNLIQGWVWDKRVWAGKLELNNEDFVPGLWDPNNDALAAVSFQSGIGDNLDIEVKGIELVVPSGTRNLWVPQVRHGDYYDFRDHFYFYSDDSVTQIIPATTITGLNFVDLDFGPKDGIPITVAKWEFDVDKGRYDKFNEFIQKFEFTGSRDINDVRQDTRDDAGDIIFTTIDTSLPEFLVDHRTSPFRLWLNDSYIETHGQDPVLGLADMEQLGTSLGIDNEEFNTRFSPLITSGIQIISYFDEDGLFTNWAIVDEVTVTGQCTVDVDLGVVKFGTGEFFHPAGGEKVAAFYISTTSVEYERDFTGECISATEATVNPMGRTSSNGFLYLKREIIDPFAITLTADAPLIALNFYGPVSLGTSSLRLNAEVTSRTGELVEGSEVIFFIKNSVGSFSGGINNISSLTGFDGLAHTNFNTPRSIDNIGGIGELVTSGTPLSTQSTITMSGVSLIGDATTWQIYKVFTDDPILGVDSAQQYYQDYFTEEGIEGPTAIVESDGTGWENTHRLLTGLLGPNRYDAAFRNGKKQLLITFESTAINPHTFNEGAFVPLRPLSYTIGAGGETNVVVSGILDIPEPAVGSGINNRLAGYFVAGPTVATLQASVVNDRLGTTVFSNEIDVEIRVPSSMDGTVLIEALNDVQRSGLAVPLSLESGTLPLGFRLRGFGVTLAGVLGGLTYLDINRPTEIVGHAFEVVESGVS